jgi:hypothetical protein
MPSLQRVPMLECLLIELSYEPRFNPDAFVAGGGRVFQHPAAALLKRSFAHKSMAHRPGGGFL